LDSPFYQDFDLNSCTLAERTHLMKATNQEAPSKLENTIFETNGSKTVAENKKEVTAQAVTP
jgi:hypothetical protein